jgi:hypothetical protein
MTAEAAAGATALQALRRRGLALAWFIDGATIGRPRHAAARGLGTGRAHNNNATVVRRARVR